MNEADQRYYARRAEEELDLASATTDPAVKAFHLNRAAEFATKRERAAAGRCDGGVANAPMPRNTSRAPRRPSRHVAAEM